VTASALRYSSRSGIVVGEPILDLGRSLEVFFRLGGISGSMLDQSQVAQGQRLVVRALASRGVRSRSSCWSLRAVLRAVRASVTLPAVP